MKTTLKPAVTFLLLAKGANCSANAVSTQRAKVAYQDFLTLWRDADPNIPIFIAAKAEYAKLK